jgi:hypothetical protein
MKYNRINLEDKASDLLVLHCADPRFQGAYREVIDSFGQKYDLMERAGASKAVAEDPTTITELEMLHGLHGFSTVHILDHIDCGAYGEVSDEVDAHSYYLKLAAKGIKQAIPNLKIVPHLLGEEEELELPQDLVA